MLDCGGDDVRSANTLVRSTIRIADKRVRDPFDEAAYREIIGFGTAGGENYLIWPGVYQRGDLMSCLIDRRTSLLAKEMNARRVAEFSHQIGKHRLDDQRIDWCCCTVVEVNAAKHIVSLTRFAVLLKHLRNC